MTPEHSDSPALAGNRLRTLSGWAIRHPVATVLATALAARCALAIAFSVLVEGVLIPDEQQYITLAHATARGLLAELWPGYGESLFWSTATFSIPLAGLFRLFGTEPLLGRLLAAAAGAATAALSALLANRTIGPRAALTCGLLVALLPSQLLWSSVILRESMIWAALAAIAVLAARLMSARDGRRLGMLAAGLPVTLFALSRLREYTFFVAAWALVGAVLVARPARPVIVRAAVILTAFLVPMIAGLGIGGIGLVERAVPILGTIRTHLSLGAESSFIEADVVDVPRDPDEHSPSEIRNAVKEVLIARGVSSAHAEQAVHAAETEAAHDDGRKRGRDGARSGPTDGRDDAQAVLRRALTYLERELGLRIQLVMTNDDESILVHEGARAALTHLPGGLAATQLRPFPWEPTRGLGPTLARVENLFWYALYALAAVGIWSYRKKRQAIAFPALTTALLMGVAALTQGNLGTAFRHRGQILWALALLAACGVEHLASRRRTPAPTA